MTPGSERSIRSFAAAAESAPLSTAARRNSICASTCARSSFNSAPTERFSSDDAGFNQLSVTSVITPDLRPSHASRNALNEASSVARAAWASNRERISAKRSCRPSAELMPRAARVCESFESGVDMGCDKNISQGHVSMCPCDGNKRRPEAGAGYLSLLGSGLGGSLGREGLGLFGDLREAGGVLHGHVCQDFAVEGNSRGFQAMDQLAIGDAVLASSGSNTLNPQAAILPFLYAAIAKCVAIRSIGRFLRGLVELALGEEKSLGPLEVLLTPGPAFSAAFYACHGFAPLVFRETKQVAERRGNAPLATGLFPRCL